jgi:hypothetical protein
MVSGRPAALRTRSRRSLRSLAARSTSARAALRLWSRSHSGSVRANARQAVRTAPLAYRRAKACAHDATATTPGAGACAGADATAGLAPSSSTGAGSAGLAAAACASRSHVRAAHSRLSVLPCARCNGASAQRKRARGSARRRRCVYRVSTKCSMRRSDAPSPWETRRRPRRRRPALRRCASSGHFGSRKQETETKSPGPLRPWRQPSRS